MNEKEFEMKWPMMVLSWHFTGNMDVKSIDSNQGYLHSSRESAEPSSEMKPRMVPPE
jgi:hypothetical protein